jgi:hypothetical protein
MSVKRHVKVSGKRKAAVSRRVASALAGFLKKMNPGTKAAGAKVQRLKGGVIKITPIKRNAGSRFVWQEYNTRAEAMAAAKRLRASGTKVKVSKSKYGYSVKS